MFKIKRHSKESFKEEDKPLVRAVLWPDGWAVDTPSGLWYITGGRRIQVYSDRCLQSWHVPVRHGTDEVLSATPVQEGVLGFRTGTLIRDFSDGKIYLVTGSLKRHITNPDVLKILNATILDVSKDEANIHKDGEPIDGLEQHSDSR